MTDRIDTLRVFVAVAELHSFAEAARRLNRTPAAVTRAVAALEEELRVRLLNRTTRSVSLTDEGARHLEVARRLLAVNEELEGLEGSAEVPPHGVLHMTAPATFGRLHVLPAIVRFLERHPLVDVRAQFTDRVVSLVDEGLDCGVRLGDLPDSSLRAIRVGQVGCGVYASPAYLAHAGVPQTLQDLASHAIISSTAITPVPERWSWPGLGQVTLRPRLVVNTNDAAADAAAAGLGLVMLVSYQADAHIREGRLVPVLTRFQMPSIPVHIIHPSGRHLPGKLRLFIDHLATELRARFA